MGSTGPALPPELFDDILDLLEPPASYYPAARHREFVLALVVCARVCRGWLPRAQFRLYTSVSIHKHDAALNLIRTLTIQPKLAPLIRHVVAEAQYLPLLSLLSKLPKVKVLVIGQTSWSHCYPLAQTARLGRRTSITHLSLYDVSFASPADLLHLVRSFPALVELGLSIMPLGRTNAEPTVTQLHARRPCWASPSLRALDISHTYDRALPFLRLLGHDLHRLTFRIAIDLHPEPSLPIGPDIGECVAVYPDLRAFTLSLTPYPGEDTHPSHITSPVKLREQHVAEQAYARLHDYLARTLAAVRASELRSLSIVLYACQLRMLAGTTPASTPQYLLTRTGLLDLIIGQAVRDLLVGSPTFSGLHVLALGVHEDAPDVYDRGWWEAQVRRRLPGLRAGIVSVTLHGPPFKPREYYPLWEPERPAAVQGISGEIRDDAPQAGLEVAPRPCATF